MPRFALALAPVVVSFGACGRTSSRHVEETGGAKRARPRPCEDGKEKQFRGESCVPDGLDVEHCIDLQGQP